MMLGRMYLVLRMYVCTRTGSILAAVDNHHYSIIIAPVKKKRNSTHKPWIQYFFAGIAFEERGKGGAHKSTTLHSTDRPEGVR